MEKRFTEIELQEPAASFVDGFPIGNGRISAMVFGSIPEDVLTLNHEWLWSAEFKACKKPDEVADKIPELRRLLRSGAFQEAGQFGNDNFSPRGFLSGKQERIDSFLSSGSFRIATDNGVLKYSRKLDMTTALATSWHGCHFRDVKRECFVSATDDLIYYRVYCEDGSNFSGHCCFDRVHSSNDELEYVVTPCSLSLSGCVPGGVRFKNEAALYFKGGTSCVCGNRVHFDNVSEVIAVIDIDVNVAGRREFNCRAVSAPPPDWKAVFKRHSEFWSNIYNRSVIDIPNGGRAMQYFNFGRYLLLASSLLGELPANLQGKWNDSPKPPWQCDYHLNINLQMNYWGSNENDLAVVNNALFNYLEKLAVSGREVAEKTWGAKGIFLPHATDAWAQAVPEAWGFSVWLGAAPWLAQHFMKHYRYTLDREFLEKRAWPFIREAAVFFETLLEYDENGVLEILPSQSPENQFKGGFFPVSLCISSACDIELLSELLRDAIHLSELLEVDADYRKEWQKMLERMPEIQISKDGRILEWGEGFEEIEPGHRHISQLIGLFPGSVISADKTPELYEAARKTMEFRVQNFAGFMSGWSRAWMANFYTRFFDGDRALEQIEILAGNQSSSSLLDLHPPKIFQIDGNLGILSAVPAMLIQTAAGVLRLLPALPKAWPDGRAENLRAENALKITLEWRNSQLTYASIQAEKDVTIQLLLPGKDSVKTELTLGAGESYIIGNPA